MRAVGRLFPNAACSSSPNGHERIKKRNPSSPSRTNMPPRPGTTSIISWVCLPSPSVRVDRLEKYRMRHPQPACGSGAASIPQVPARCRSLLLLAFNPEAIALCRLEESHPHIARRGVIRGGCRNHRRSGGDIIGGVLHTHPAGGDQYWTQPFGLQACSTGA